VDHPSEAAGSDHHHTDGGHAPLSRVLRARSTSGTTRPSSSPPAHSPAWAWSRSPVCCPRGWARRYGSVRPS
jgi:hypothetical protein